MAQTISTDQFFPSGTLTARTANKPDGSPGDPAPLFGVPVWATSDATVVTVTASADGMTFSATPVAPGGPARISVTAEGDPTPGVDTIVGVSEDITVTLGASSEAKVLTLTLGAPVNKVAAPPPAPPAAPPPAPPAGP